MRSSITSNGETLNPNKSFKQICGEASDCLIRLNRDIDFDRQQDEEQTLIVNNRQEFDELINPVFYTGYLKNLALSVSNYSQKNCDNYNLLASPKLVQSKEGLIMEQQSINLMKLDAQIMPRADVLLKLCSNGLKGQTQVHKAMIKIQIQPSQTSSSDNQMEDKSFLKKIIERQDKSHTQVKYRNPKMREEITMELYWDTLYVRILKERQVLSAVVVQPEFLFQSYNNYYSPVIGGQNINQGFTYQMSQIAGSSEQIKSSSTNQPYKVFQPLRQSQKNWQSQMSKTSGKQIAQLDQDAIRDMIIHQNSNTLEQKPSQTQLLVPIVQTREQGQTSNRNKQGGGNITTQQVNKFQQQKQSNNRPQTMMGVGEEPPQLEKTKKFSNGLFSEFHHDLDQFGESEFPLNISNNREQEKENTNKFGQQKCNKEFNSGLKTQQLSDNKLNQKNSDMMIDIKPSKDVNSTDINISLLPKQIQKYNSKRDKQRNKKQFKSDFQEKSKTLNEILADDDENYYSSNQKQDDDFLRISNDHELVDQNHFRDIEISTPRGTEPNSMCRSTTTASRTINSKKQKHFINDSIAVIKHQNQNGNNTILIQPQKFISPTIQHKIIQNKQNKTTESQPNSQKQSLPEIPQLNNKFIRKSPQNANFSLVDNKGISKANYIGAQIFLKNSSQSPKYLRDHNPLQKSMNLPFSTQVQQQNQNYNPYQNMQNHTQTTITNPATKFISKTTALNLQRHQSPLVGRIIENSAEDITQQLINQMSKAKRENGAVSSLGQRQLISKIINRERQIASRKDQIPM
ncbi:UNKNOWN [Stylonychia lemnae]|uniref:Uncharacterized protein n=1 Tax=Stylonychia lemnae TaxID=5949 RepID=A0A078B8H2_STYLE|nr:UNKNOWN [Stylonychia lemnae]|eukprot:CDW89853.1 UNKNOWN [Stylonychia lemnae]